MTDEEMTEGKYRQLMANDANQERIVELEAKVAAQAKTIQDLLNTL